MNNIENVDIVNVEIAYRCLAEYVLDFIANRNWESSGIRSQVTPGSVTFSDHWLLWQGDKTEKAAGWGDSNILRTATAAVRFLRDDLLATTGDRIWGLTFTLYPDGKFKIEYDYNKPEGYEETDETISLDEALQSLPVTDIQKK